GVGDHELERQTQYRDGVVRIEPAALPLGGTESEEILEESLVSNDAADQRHQHGHGHETRQPDARFAGVKLEMHMDEMMAALGRALCRFRQRFAAGDIQSLAMELLLVVLMEHPDRRIFDRRQTNTPEMAARWVDLYQICLRLAHRIGPIPYRLRPFRSVSRLRFHPACDGFVKHSQRAGEENREQKPAGDESTPGMQPRHGLAQAALLFNHPVDIDCAHPITFTISMPAKARTAAGSNHPNQPRRTSRTANTQITAPGET